MAAMNWKWNFFRSELENLARPSTSSPLPHHDQATPGPQFEELAIICNQLKVHKVSNRHFSKPATGRGSTLTFDILRGLR